MSRRSHSKPAEAAAGVPPTKTIAQLRMEVDLLENAIKDRKLLFLDLCEQRSASAAADEDATRVTPPEDPLEEARRLASRNALLRDELKVLGAIERQYANDPRVRDKRNEVRLVQMQIAQVEREVDTLQMVKKWRDEGLRAIGRTEEQTRRMRGQQNEMNSHLREEVRQRMEELRELEKTDMEVHTRFVRLQDQVKLSVTDADVQQLRQTLEAQNAEIENLSSKEATWRKQRASVREEDYRVVAKHSGECAKLAEEEERLQELLRQKESELKRSYYLLKRYGTAPRAPMSD
ncbi:conserved hypothetical protein [Leishmania major strain Friedlin]|uniref:Uncharacterized protein n=1 Tax=Leishmania major TaxID=5664 RepID=Q4Q8H7_LEIMA|nr:conserved hypothetical protein [Leishmania major strain Friedlin]CAG9577195.1 hypothetical_protein_-_conserved [Leishmania major strain Friedlin]CAJ05214.1 conserved hypothetical protein [Leishmania major strain Friedlin]|eukprot:XP_001684371.1 conserved hypothetical protein [Leishmania major strain Friedlin]